MRLVLMGVSGCGKTTIGKELSIALEIPFYDGDDFHSEANKEKMSRGHPLTDADRKPWLESLAVLLQEKTSIILACSALKESYREVLRMAPDVRFVYLKGSCDLIQERLEERQGHFFNPRLLESQFANLEEPQDALVVSIEASSQEIALSIQNQLLE
jgi:gluconokinase